MLVVVNDGNGQMCNKILFQINVLASAYIHGYSVVYYNRQKFDGFVLEQELLERQVHYKGNMPRILYNTTRAFHKVFSKIGVKCSKFVMVSAKNQEEAKTLLESDYLLNHKSYLYGWPFYDLASLRKSADLVREYMAPTDGVKQYVEIYMEELREKYDCVIGVHLRRGDYKNWRGGAYYYSNQQYKKCMDRVAEKLEKKGKQVFVLFSNEKIDLSEFEDKRYSIIKSSGTAAQDFHMMAKCDYLLGPPSSFSGLASFLGKTPRYMIEDANREIDNKDFLIWLEQTDSWGCLEEGIIL